MMWWEKLKQLFPGYRRNVEREMEEELEALRAMADPQDRAGLALAAENVRDVWRWNWLENLLKDIRYGARQLRRAPVFTVLSIGTLTIGITAAAALAALLNDAFFAQLPVKEPGQLRQFEWSVRGTPSFSRRGSDVFTHAAYEYVRARTTSFSDVLCWSESEPINLGMDGFIEQASAQFVSGNFFRALGVATAVGRPISEDDLKPGAPAVAIIGRGAWQRLFGSDPNVLGRTIQVNGRPFVVAGVTSTEFHNTPSARWTADLTLPASELSIIARDEQRNANGGTCRMIGRLKPDVSDSQARLESERLIHEAFLTYPQLKANGTKYDGQFAIFAAFRGLRGIDQMDSRGLWGLTPLLAIVLLIGASLAITCANIGGMFLARGMSRRHEIATRLAIGAGRGRVVRQLLTESLLLASAAGFLGIVISYELLTASAWNFTLDVHVIAVVGAIACATGVICGLAPSLTATRLDLTAAMKQSSPGASTFRTGKILVGIQVALSFSLLVATGLQTESLRRLLAPTDFEPERLLTTQAHPRTAGYSPERIHEYFEQAVRRLETVPGVVSASVSSGNGIIGDVGLTNATQQRAIIDYVSPRFFATMKIRIVRGRDFEWTDRKGAASVVIVNEAFARAAYPNSDPLGKIVQLQASHEIVGVVADSNNSAGDAYGMGQSVGPAIYIPFQQQQKGLWATMTVSVRTESNLLSLMPAVGRVITEIDPKVAVDPIEPNSDRVIFRLREVRMTLMGLGLFALIALSQASVGIYGTLAYFVSRRTVEIGLRMALGAKQQDVVRMVVRQSVAPVAIGILLGLAGTPFLEQLMQNSGALVGHVVVLDQLAIIAIVSALFLSALLAAFTPAWRASRLAPMQALRHD